MVQLYLIQIYFIISFQHSIYSVFLIDHAWTYEVNFARTQLKTIPGLADRMAMLMGVTGNVHVVYNYIAFVLITEL